MPVRLAQVGSYLDDRLAFFAERMDESGAAVRCRLNGDGWLLNDPEDVRHVLVRNEANYVKARRVTGPRAEYPPPHSLLTSAGQEHRRRRRAMRGAFPRRLVEAVAERTRANAERLAGSWVDGTELDVAAAIGELTQRTLLETLLSSAPSEHLDRLAAATRARRRAFERHFLSLLPIPHALPSPANGEYLRATRMLRAAVDEEIAARRSAARRPGDMLSLLMETTFDDGTAMSDLEVREEVLMLSLTGYDSVNEALQWTLYLLARHPEADAALAAEALAGAQTAYATSAIRESLRLFPPTWMFVRIALGEDPLPSGAVIPAGAKAYACPYVVQRNPAYWPEPDRFLPERFADGAADGRPRYAYFPFGGGPHVCIGEMLAMAQIVAVLATVARRWRLSLPDGAVVVPDGGLTLCPRGGLRMRAELRESTLR